MSTTHIPLSMKIDALLWRAMIGPPSYKNQDQQGVFCGICRERIEPGDKIAWDHTHPEGLGGKTAYKDVRPVHDERDGEKGCHKRKTWGSKATSAGSDIHMIAKAKRIARGGKKRKGRAIQSRGFDKTKTRKLSGEVVTR